MRRRTSPTGQLGGMCIIQVYRIAPPEQAKFVHVAPSPDGHLLAFTGFEPGGERRLWMLRLDSLSAQPLTGTEGALLPFWSSDSRFIGFWTAQAEEGGCG